MLHAARRLCRIAALSALTLGAAPAHAACDWVGWDWLTHTCNQAARAFHEGDNQLYLTGLAHHGRGTYTAEKLQEFNEDAWGLGFGREVVDERDNSHEIYAMAFSDSHAKPQYTLGYGWLARWPMTENSRFGLGFTAFLALRSDYCGYFCPVPAILPLASLQYRKVSLMASYLPRLPGNEGNGDVLFVFGKISLD
jgi:palmitoyl transferase